jgi:hypothetical protein
LEHAILSNLAFTLPFPLSRYYNYAPPLDFAKLTHHSVFGFAAYIVGILALFGLYLLGLRTLLTADKTVSEGTKLRLVLLGGLVFAAILIFSYPQTAIDLFVYAIRTRGWVRYGFSPFSTPPELLPAYDPWLSLAGEWSDAASPYGPIWEWLSLGTYQLAGGSFLGHLFAIKILSVLAYLGCARLMYQILRLFKPEWAAAGTAFFALNPLVLLEGVQNAHNDILMVLFFLLAIWAYVQLIQGAQGRHGLFAVIFVGAFAASILVKFMTLLVLPFFMLALALRKSTWLQRMLIPALYGIAVMVLVTLAMWPYWPGLDHWAVLQAGGGAGRSLFALLVLVIRSLSPTSKSFDIVRLVLYSVLGGIYLWGLWQIWRMGKNQTPGSDRMRGVFVAAFAAFFGYVTLVAPVFHAWYLLWLIPLGALLLPDIHSTSAVFVSSLTALLIIPYYETVRVWIPYLNENHLLGHLIGVSLLLVPVALSLVRPIHFLPTDQGRGAA